MKQMKHVLAILVVVLPITSAVPLAEAHHRGRASSSRVTLHDDHSSSSHRKHPSYNARYDHRDRDHPSRDNSGNNYGFGGDCGWLHCHTAMPWG
jgi:hypothetical protein